MARLTSQTAHKPATVPKVKFRERVGGRPSDYSEALAAEICSRIANGKNLRAVCKAKTMPHRATVFRWLTKYPDFAEQYARAVEQLGFVLFEEVLEIADNSSRDYKATKTGMVADIEHIQRTRLRVDARKWFIQTLTRKKYGEAGAQGHSRSENSQTEQVMRWAKTDCEAIPDPSTKS